MRHPPSKRRDAGGTAFREANVSCWATNLQGLGSQSCRQHHLPDSVKLARRPVKPLVAVRKDLGASPSLAATFQGVMSAADGRYHAATSSERGGCLRTATKVQLL